MQMTEAERAASIETLAPALVDLIARHVAGDEGGDEGDVASVGVAVCISVAVALMAPSMVDARAAVALITCIAEAAAEDVFA